MNVRKYSNDGWIYCGAGFFSFNFSINQIIFSEIEPYIYLEYLIQWQFRKPHGKQIPKLSLIFEFDEKITQICKVKGKAPFLQNE